MEHYYKNIQGWCAFEDLYSFVVKNCDQNSHFVEVGSWKGCSAAYMGVEIINSGKNIVFDIVDTFAGSPEHGEVNKNDLYAEFSKNIQPVMSVVGHVHIMPSVEASRLYQDGTLDFVFIDANHDYENAHLDISSWYPKLKWGGIIAGDDYREYFPGVMGAVNNFFSGKPIYSNGPWWAATKT